MSACCKKPVPVDEEFENYARIINSLIITLRRPEDRECAKDILMHCTKLSNSGKHDVRVYNNAFVCYFLKVLYTTASSQPLEIYDIWYVGTESQQIASPATTHFWLEENKSYFAMGKTADGAVIFYSAVATDPSAGWDKGGIKKALQAQEEESLKEETKVDRKRKC